MLSHGEKGGGVSLSMIKVGVAADEVHEYASGITAGEVILNVHGKRSGAVAALVDGI